MTRLFADEDFPLPVVAELRALGHDVLTTLDAGLAGVGTPDPDILAEATRLGRAVLTANRGDFARLHRADPTHAGVIGCTRDADVVALAARIHAAVVGLATLVGQHIVIRRPNMSTPPTPAAPPPDLPAQPAS